MTENNHLSIQGKAIPRVESWEEAWQALKEIFNIDPNDVQKVQLQKFYELLREENQNVNLTRLDSLPDFLTFHLLDTASLLVNLQADFLKNKFRYIDLGSGCGVPGLILHILLSPHFDFETTLCDSVRKKTVFLEKAVSTLELTDKIKVATARTETLAEEKRKYNLITARAMAKPPEAIKQVLPLLNWGGLYIAQSTTSLQTEEIFKELKKRSAQITSEETFLLDGKPRVIARIEKKNL